MVDILTTVSLCSTTLAYFKQLYIILKVNICAVYFYYSRTFYIFYYDYMIM